MKMIPATELVPGMTLGSLNAEEWREWYHGMIITEVMVGTRTILYNGALRTGPCVYVSVNYDTETLGDGNSFYANPNSFYVVEL